MINNIIKLKWCCKNCRKENYLMRGRFITKEKAKQIIENDPVRVECRNCNYTQIMVIQKAFPVLDNQVKMARKRVLELEMARVRGFIIVD